MVVKAVRDLDDANPGVGKEPDGAGKEPRLRHEVGVEHGHKRRVGDGQCMVDVAGLGMAVVGAGQIAGTFRGAIIAKPGAAAIVGDPYLEVGPIECLRADDGLFQNVERLVVGGDDEVDRGPAIPRDGGKPGFVDVGFTRAIGAADQCRVEDDGVEHGEQLDRQYEQREAQRRGRGGPGNGHRQPPVKRGDGDRANAKGDEQPAAGTGEIERRGGDEGGDDEEKGGKDDREGRAGQHGGDSVIWRR